MKESELDKEVDELLEGSGCYSRIHKQGGKFYITIDGDYIKIDLLIKLGKLLEKANG